MYAVSYPKARKGEGVAKEVKVKPTYKNELISRIFFTHTILDFSMNSDFLSHQHCSL